MCELGVAFNSEIAKPTTARTARGPLRVVLLSRLDPTKGIDVLVRAIASVKDAPLTLDVYGIVQGETGKRINAALRKLAEADNRIGLRAPIPIESVVEKLRDYDLLAVPSQWMETGPLVVLEAFAAGIPVIGSRLGGIAELVTDGVDGVLVEATDALAWGRELRRLSEDRLFLKKLRRGVRPPRTMDSVAKEMAAVYRKIVNSHLHRDIGVSGGAI